MERDQQETGSTHSFPEQSLNWQGRSPIPLAKVNACFLPLGGPHPNSFPICGGFLTHFLIKETWSLPGWKLKPLRWHEDSRGMGSRWRHSIHSQGKLVDQLPPRLGPWSAPTEPQAPASRWAPSAAQIPVSMPTPGRNPCLPPIFTEAQGLPRSWRDPLMPQHEVCILVSSQSSHLEKLTALLATFINF